MTDEQIIKALEHCSNAGRCQECAFNDRRDATCINNLMRHALDLINRQKVKIEKLETARQKQGRLLREERAQKYELIDKLSTIRLEACKEFAKKLCGHRVANDPVVIAANVELRQMTEVLNEN